MDAAVAGCKAKYGAAPGYLLCWVTSAGCAFNATTNGTCTKMCQTCLGAYDNSSGCSVAGADSCGTVRNTNVCICSK